jgi:hypothetical protein
VSDCGSGISGCIGHLVGDKLGRVGRALGRLRRRAGLLDRLFGRE